jgi:drug/metabolite transporter (DMT)-like permease
MTTGERNCRIPMIWWRFPLQQLLLLLPFLSRTCSSFQAVPSINRDMFLRQKNHHHLEVKVKSKAFPNVGPGKNGDPPFRKQQTRRDATFFDFWDKDDQESERRKGALVLFSVPLAWGTFEPAVRLVYQLQPDIPPFFFSFIYYLAAVASLYAFSFFLPENRAEEESLAENDSIFLPIKGGLELGTYLFVGNALQVIGLKTVPSDRAAFLLQLTTIFVPLVQAIFARNLLVVPLKIWLGCFLALVGVGLMGIDGSDNSSLSIDVLQNLQFSQGDFFIMLGAFSYTFHCIRLELYAKTTSALRLATAKATVETLWSAIAAIISVLAATTSLSGPVFASLQSSGQDILSYLNGAQQVLDQNPGILLSEDSLLLSGATAWVGIVTVAYTIYAQSFGQSRVSPASANLIYAIQPIFTAFFAWTLLGEKLGIFGYAGGLLIGLAVLLVVKDGESNADSSILSETKAKS